MGRTQREHWADSARGMAIIAVVLGHVFLQESPAAQWSLWGPAEELWRTVRDLLLPVRMPLFFLIAGYFAAHVIRRPWPTVLRTRTLNLYYVYVVWLVIQSALFLSIPHEGASAAGSVEHFMAQLSYAPSNLWFLVALAVFFVVAKLGRRLAPVVLAASALLSWLGFMNQLPEIISRTPMPEYLVFFLLGAYVPAVLRAIPGHIAVSVGCFVALVVGVYAMDVAEDRATWTVMLALSSCAGVTAVVSALKLLEARDRLPRITGWIGQRTLPIYVAQMPLVVLIDQAIRLLPDRTAQSIFGNPALSLVFPLLVTALVITVALSIHRLLRQPAPWLFRAPWLTRSEARAKRDPVAVG